MTPTQKLLLAIGMLPLVPPDRIESVGNVAGVGAKLALLSQVVRANVLEQN